MGEVVQVGSGAFNPEDYEGRPVLLVTNVLSASGLFQTGRHILTLEQLTEADARALAEGKRVVGVIASVLHMVPVQNGDKTDVVTLAPTEIPRAYAEHLKQPVFSNARADGSRCRYKELPLGSGDVVLFGECFAEVEEPESRVIATLRKTKPKLRSAVNWTKVTVVESEYRPEVDEALDLEEIERLPGQEPKP